VQRDVHLCLSCSRQGLVTEQHTSLDRTLECRHLHAQQLPCSCSFLAYIPPTSMVKADAVGGALAKVKSLTGANLALLHLTLARSCLSTIHPLCSVSESLPSALHSRRLSPRVVHSTDLTFHSPSCSECMSSTPMPLFSVRLRPPHTHTPPPQVSYAFHRSVSKTPLRRLEFR
jgi:hypothetical protein